VWKHVTEAPLYQLYWPFNKRELNFSKGTTRVCLIKLLGFGATSNCYLTKTDKVVKVLKKKEKYEKTSNQNIKY